MDPRRKGEVLSLNIGKERLHFDSYQPKAGAGMQNLSISFF